MVSLLNVDEADILWMSGRLRNILLNSIFNYITDTRMKVAIMTHIPTPETFQPALDFDWSQSSLEELFSTDHWQKFNHDAFIDVRNILQKKGIKTLEIYTKTHPQTAFAFGYIFRREADFSLCIHHFDEIWSTQYLNTSPSHLSCISTEGNIGSQHMAVAISITQDVEYGLKQFIKDNDIFRCYLTCAPSNKKTPYNISNDVIASEIAEEVRNAIIDTRKIYPTTDIHLFAAVPIPLAYMIGWRLNACGRIHLYHHDRNTSTYAKSWILDGND